jgi:predicted nuclease of restriction endonuclease-like (RecB) superfamily
MFSFGQDKSLRHALKRQKKSALFLRLATSTDKEGILKLAQQGQIVEKPTDILREPYVLEFLKIPEPYHLSEADLEKRIIDHLQHFLLELGKGFAFIGRQYRITLGNRHHYVDLVFYQRILKCFVLIDLKKGDVSYEDVGQMNTYLGYFENEENTEGDNPPIGIVLAKEKDDLLVKYAMHNISSQLSNGAKINHPNLFWRFSKKRTQLPFIQLFIFFR